ncbi:glycosyltransferase family 61 protein [Phenylobacterium sp.]|uniref:glycosyltransferase family 61 protein n=1 Tax=Phenylobacterium sp. TaxID=1871053 RepID=UPI0025CDD193|nr:glycosyltransferase family 61 protein [Phenylobacterium sp.]
MIVSQLRAGAVYALSNMALISGSSLIYSPSLDKGFATFPLNTAEEYLQDEVMSRMRRVTNGGQVEFELTQPVQFMAHLKQDAVPLNLMHSHNYYHFLIEALPSLLFLLERQVIGGSSIIVSGLLHPNMWTALRYLLSNAEMPVLQLRQMQMVTCDKVVTSQPASHAAQLLEGGTSDWQYDSPKLRALRRRFEPLWATAAEQPRRKIYVRRVSRVRSLSNAPEVEQLAQEAGYTVVQPERMGFFEQVRLFSHASHIMGPTGAWAANLLFAPQNASIDVFYPETARTPKTVWGTLGEALGASVNDIYCPVTRVHAPFPIHSDFRVPLDLLGDLLRRRI